MERELDRIVDATIEEAFLEQRNKYNYDEEIENAEEFCCLECQRQAAYFL